MKYLKRIAFDKQEYIIMRKALRYYIQTLSFSKRIQARKSVEPILAGSVHFKITKDVSDIIIKAVQKLRKDYTQKNKLSYSVDTDTRIILKNLNTYVNIWNQFHPSPKDLEHKFQRVYAMHKKHQDRQALDLLFAHLELGEHGCYCTSCLSELGLQALYNLNSKSMNCQFCVLKLLLSGIEVTHSQNEMPLSLLNQFYHFQKLGNHYLVGRVNYNVGNIYLKPITFADSEKFLRYVKAAVDNYINKHN